MSHRTLISAAELLALQASSLPLVLLDCGFDLGDTHLGERQFAAGHLPGAQYAHLDKHLSGAKSSRNGRHPLPAREAFAAQAGAWGITPGVQVVTYDAQGGPYAARAWWMLRWLGHAQVAVLDGGSAAWLAAGGALSTAQATAAPMPSYPLHASLAPVVLADALALPGTGLTVLDARAPERYRGDVEPLDPVGGHIPGALNRFFKHNLGPDGCFLSAGALRDVFQAFGPADQLVHQCGSGVTACHNLLAMEHAGLCGSALYPGSWSEWCSDPSRPVAKGA